jgi:hypothetical protein
VVERVPGWLAKIQGDKNAFGCKHGAQKRRRSRTRTARGSPGCVT